MLTPVFHVTQDSNFITINIKAPYTKVSDTEIFIDGSEFRFFSKPYFLRLNLPGQILEDGQETAIYDSDNGSYIVRIPKQNPGEMFEGLDMLTTLLAPKKETVVCPKIEVLSSTENVANENSEGLDHDSDDESCDDKFDWQVQQTVVHDDFVGGAKSGFGMSKCGVFKKLGEDISRELIDLAYPETTAVVDRKSLRQADEIEHFDSDHYLADLFDDDTIKCVLEYECKWNNVHAVMNNKHAENGDAFISFTDEEVQSMLQLPKKEYIFTEQESVPIFLGLVDLMLSHAYNHRITEGENTVESSWNIRKLSPTLSWLDVHSSLNDVVIAFFQRVMCYPLYRHFGLASKVLEDVQQVFTLGKKQILRNLLEIHTIFNSSDPHYVLNDLYITDYCVWIQTVNDKTIKKLSDSLAQVHVGKADVGFDLVELERVAMLASEEDGIDAAIKQMAELQMSDMSGRRRHQQTDSDDDSDESDTTESTESETDDSALSSEDSETDEQGVAESCDIVDTKQPSDGAGCVSCEGNLKTTDGSNEDHSVPNSGLSSNVRQVDTS